MAAAKPSKTETNAASSQPSTQTYTIHVLDKALDLLELLGTSSSPLSLAEISQRLKLPKSSVFRYLFTLEARGYVKRLPDSDKYRLGLKLLELGSQAISQFDMRDAALPVMRGLLESFSEMVNLAVIDGYEVIYIEVLPGKTYSIQIVGHPGQRQLAHSTALGKAMLAYWPEDRIDQLIAQHGLPAFTPHTITTIDALKAALEQVRVLGYALDDEESVMGVRCVGAPIFDHRGQAVAAISLSAPDHRMPPQQLEIVCRELVAGAATISSQLGYRR